VVSRGDFQIAVSTGGNSPALSQQVRKQLEQDFGPEYESWTAWLGRMREMMRNVLPRSDRRKELLMLLALCKPKRLSKQNQTPGGNHGPLEKSRAGSQTETRVERASA
jgi:siroheme synthase (precorrin-2 oxidase/ferrochelatase)